MGGFLEKFHWFNRQTVDELNLQELREAFQANQAYTQKLEELLQKHGLDPGDEDSHQSRLMIRLQLSEWSRDLDREELRRMMRSQVRGFIRSLLDHLGEKEQRLSSKQTDWFRDFDLMLMLNN
jgi:hypothetical protein